MAVTSDLRLVIDELVLDGVEAEDPIVGQSIARALAPALDEHGLGAALGPVTTAVSSTVGEKAAR